VRDETLITLFLILTHRSCGYIVFVGPINVLFLFRSFDDASPVKPLSAATCSGNAGAPPLPIAQKLSRGSLVSWPRHDSQQTLEVHVDIASAVHVDVADEDEKPADTKGLRRGSAALN
jgi:hypothetical protein